MDNRKWAALIDDFGQVYGDPYVAIDDGSKAIAYIMTRDRARGRDIQDWISNAHLIAAAPDLYDALEALVDACDRLGVTGGNLSYARAVLAKARGDAQYSHGSYEQSNIRSNRDAV
jgi:hypothetical protein